MGAGYPGPPDRLELYELVVATIDAVERKGATLHIYAKLGVNDRAAAVATAYENGLLVPHRD